MSTFLQMCQRVASKSGTVSGSNPTTVSSQTGRLLKIIDFVKDAWDEIQTSQDTWKWMRRDFTETITAPTQAYTPASLNIISFSRWDTSKNLYIYKTSDGRGSEGDIPFYQWRDFRPLYLMGEIKTQKPTAYSVRDYDSAIMFSDVPDVDYSIRGEYFKDNQILTNDDDVPECPARFHKAIEHLALQMLAEYDEAEYSASKASIDYTGVYAKMTTDQLELIDPYGGGPLA